MQSPTEELLRLIRRLPSIHHQHLHTSYNTLLHTHRDPTSGGRADAYTFYAGMILNNLCIQIMFVYFFLIFVFLSKYI